MTLRLETASTTIKMNRYAVVIVSLLSAATAAAQPGSDDEVPVAPPPPVQPQPQPLPPPPPGYVLVPVNANTAPQTQPWSNVSNINGQLVPVGQHTDYLYQFKRTNISTNPIGWIVGIYGVSVETALNDNLALRFDANYLSIRESNSTGYEVGASLPVYFKRTYQGPFIEPGIIIRGFHHNNTDQAFAGDASSSQDKAHVGPSVVFGWHWTFDSGLNVAMAFGMMRNMNTDQMSSSGDDIEPSGYFRVGYAF
jgi:uncharacterized protein DUF3575